MRFRAENHVRNLVAALQFLGVFLIAAQFLEPMRAHDLVAPRPMFVFAVIGCVVIDPTHLWDAHTVGRIGAGKKLQQAGLHGQRQIA